MEKAFIYLNKGLLIGFFTGLLKIMYSIRNGDFNWKLALTDLFGAVIVGYSTWALLLEYTESINWQNYIITVVMALNAFILVGFLMNPKLLKNYFNILLGNSHDRQTMEKSGKVPSIKEISSD